MVDDVVARARATQVDGLGAVAVRVEQEGAVVVGAVPWPRPWLPVAWMTGLRADLPERVDVLARAGDERHVKAMGDRTVFPCLRDAKVARLVEVLA
jgi:hypothetical protein